MEITDAMTDAIQLSISQYNNFFPHTSYRQGNSDTNLDFLSIGLACQQTLKDQQNLLQYVLINNTANT